MDWHPEGTLVSAASSSGLCRIWDARTYKNSAKLDMHKGFCFWTRFNAHGTHVVTCGMDRKIHYWDLRKSKKPVTSFLQDGVVRSACFMDNDSQLVSSTIDGSIMVHDMGTGD